MDLNFDRLDVAIGDDRGFLVAQLRARDEDERLALVK
jgi:hypothetical protein